MSPQPSPKAPPVVLGIRAFNALVFLVSLSLLIESATFTYRPGPSTYYSPFATIVVATCLCFQCLQVERIARISKERGKNPKRFQSACRYVYFGALGLASFVAAVGFALTPKPDTTALAFLTTFDALGGLWLHVLLRCSSERRPVDANRVQSEAERSAKKKRAVRTCCLTFWTRVNRFLMFIHVCIVILTASGGIQLALTYQYSNPGTVVQIRLPTGESRKTNYFCTSIASSNKTMLPTIWFEGSQAHGVVNFLGLQTILRDFHRRNSCTYDPPNFGWSDRLPASRQDYFDYFAPLVEAIGRSEEPKVMVGWGDGGNDALRHAIEYKDSTTAIVLLDVSPDGIEFLDAQRANNWTTKETERDTRNQLEARSFLAETILGIGITWGLMAIVIPNNSTGYFDESLYPRYTAQGRKEDLWAYQYYALRQSVNEPLNTYLLDTGAPRGVEVRSIMTYDAGTDATSDEFYRREKLAMLNSIAGKNVTDTVAWCKASNCSLGFPVDIPWWTAAQLVELGV